MVYKPLKVKTYAGYIKLVGFSLEKGGVDWNLYDEKGNFLCSIKIAHGKRTKQEVVSNSVQKQKRFSKKRV